MNRRHYHTSIYFLCQTYKNLEPDIRKLFSNILLFKVSKREMEDIMNEIIESHKDITDEIIKLVFDKPSFEKDTGTNNDANYFINWSAILPCGRYKCTYIFNTCITNEISGVNTLIFSQLYNILILVVIQIFIA